MAHPLTSESACRAAALGDVSQKVKYFCLHAIVETDEL
jgi:hypothetical protein